MAKFVVFITINADAQNAPGGPDMARIFSWSLRRAVNAPEGSQDATEMAGPELASGTAADVDTAKGTAQAYAEFYAKETVYVFDTDA